MQWAKQRQVLKHKGLIRDLLEHNHNSGFGLHDFTTAPVLALLERDADSSCCPSSHSEETRSGQLNQPPGERCRIRANLCRLHLDFECWIHWCTLALQSRLNDKLLCLRSDWPQQGSQGDILPARSSSRVTSNCYGHRRLDRRKTSSL